MRQVSTLRRQDGVTLIEVSIMLVATLAIVGALAPSISAVIRRSEATVAQTTMTNISTALTTMLVNLSTNFLTSNGVRNDSPAKVLLVVSDGDIPADLSGTGSATWQQTVNLTTRDFFENHLIRNAPGGNTGNAYNPPGATNVWRGAYLNGPADPDPWGNRYMVNVQYLGGGAGGTNDVVILSAGPDEEIDSAYTALDFNTVTVDDDLFVIVEP